MNKSLTELLDEILTQINEQFEEVVAKLTKRLADLATNADQNADNPKPATETPDGDEKVVRTANRKVTEKTGRFVARSPNGHALRFPSLPGSTKDLLQMILITPRG